MHSTSDNLPHSSQVTQIWLHTPSYLPILIQLCDTWLSVMPIRTTSIFGMDQAIYSNPTILVVEHQERCFKSVVLHEKDLITWWTLALIPLKFGIFNWMNGSTRLHWLYLGNYLSNQYKGPTKTVTLTESVLGWKGKKSTPFSKSWTVSLTFPSLHLKGIGNHRVCK